VVLTPQARSYSLITEVVSVSTVAGITAGTLYVEARRPAGRSNPPA
jgi:hypothetical protein